ncbi:MAG: peptidoglycan DD-metalloendopeptidase family protein [Capnocytophaga sp.]|nr:peptidoglycan DD-metalloendopeptidase family protein [Capnocytophaga sp.]
MNRKIGFLWVCLAVFVSACKEKQPEVKEEIKPEPIPVYEYGFNIAEYKIVKDTVKKGDTFGKILNDHYISPKKVFDISEMGKDILSPKDFRIGQPYALVFHKNTPDSLDYFIYQPNLTHFVKVHLKDSLFVEKIDRKITIIEKEGGGYIKSNLTEDVIKAGMSFSAAYTLSQIFDYTIDFFHLQEDDKFKVIYDERYVDDTIYAGLVRVKAAYFEHKGKPFYAFNFETDTINHKWGYYDENGNMMKRMFLKAPLDIFRITSRFGMRYHPVLHRMKGHFGTDYAAPTGTPIRATANGTVTQAGFTSGNGNYVKIRHNKTYETQYLHMSKIIAKKGQYVSQGDIIGLVGSTGLATGPHVCYRFWKNGQQVDPLKEVLPEAVPIDDKLKPRYLEYIAPLKAQLDAVPYTKVESIGEVQADNENDTQIKDSIN